ncbi:class I adenylate-forming enzyme family protein (plasmid) [Streptomyces sp. FXJ1.172]|jgi:acyl-coenzyme A synthetase/AMP-(fatty) acid ligase|uniref:class I adenylate-forming enzyme family protein n=1 Tax=Streptomyces sp. FXJ1.172 TaxID=710705 RepID=UPI0023DCF405|nr:class I adenylate-forming enzyme family protein [Streptomyces sp. FXJ1.172]WEP01002.1 class I adenylate-forming enzyme family protein [Streptomyces sp. FXJ1.172]
MKGSTAYTSIQKRGLHIGLLPEMAAAVNPSTPISLDHDLDVLPEAGRRLTVAQYAGHVDDLAARLWAAGVRPDERVVIYKTANADHWMLASAVSRIGAVVVNLSPALDPATVAVLLERVDQPTLLTDGTKFDLLADVPLTVLTRRVITSAGERPGAIALAGLAGAPRVKPVVRPIDEAAVITHTSGTTGIPKLVVHTPRTQGIRLLPQWRLLSLMRKKDTVAIHVPFVHSRMVAAMSLALLKEYPVLLLRETDPAIVAEQFLRHRPGFIEALPNSLMEWEGLTEDPRMPFASVKVFSSTFDAIHPGTMSKLLNASTRRGALFFQIYGQSEVGPAVGRAYFRHSAHKANGRCVGWQMPLGAAKVRVVSRDGKRPTEQNPGRIEVAWPGIAKTYFGEQERYDDNRKGEWWGTGDVGYFTRFGCLHMLDREVDMIPGIKSSLEIEDVVLSKLDELSELVVVQGPNSEPVPVICTVDDKPLDPARWRAAVAGFPQLADPVQIPQAELPRTATLKVQRLALARRFENQLQERA